MSASATTAVDLIIGSSLITAETIAQELRERLVRELFRWYTLDETELIRVARSILEKIEPVLARQL